MSKNRLHVKSEEQEKSRSRSLSKIKFILRLTSIYIPFKPRTYFSIIFSYPFILCGIFFNQAFFILAGIVFFVVWTLNTKESWFERILKILQDYHPVNEQAYQLLLSQIENDTADRQSILNWLADESKNINRYNHNDLETKKNLLSKRLIKKTE